jgi:magnesium-protoporphyrin O-methyltransferase
VGVLDHELLAAGAVRAVTVDASPAYLTLCAEEAERRGHADRLEQLLGDFVDLAPEVEPADVVTLDRVICCYPHMRVLVGASATRARRLYGVVFPREHAVMRFGVAVLNLVQRLLGSAFRVYVHQGRDVDDELDERGFRRVWTGGSFLWQARLYERVERSHPNGTEFHVSTRV